ncbi:hypothetical protein [Rhodococcus qingshengii]|uniref:hypothetical protein n=1 Tax=Rhodococcus qingshengii TaxID=334542 RepID=UPI002034FBEA|nr:hypothetical protein [Rhodococcus qingshengii]
MAFTGRVLEPAQRRVRRYVQLMSLDDAAGAQAAMPASAVATVAEEHLPEGARTDHSPGLGNRMRETAPNQ